MQGHEATELSPTGNEIPVETAPARPLRILLAEDSADNRLLLEVYLKGSPHRLIFVNDGKAAVDRFSAESFDLILMDVQMPVMDGLEATRRIKADPRGKETVIFTLTASALYEDHQKIDQCGADDFLPKPCREDELLEKMRTHLNIAYDYEDLSEGEPPAGLAALSAATLGRLPLELIKELRTATLRGNKRRLDNVILKVGETGDAGSAEALQELADRYDYDALTRLLEEVSLR
jgi:CheY-like chemotaxis protein